MTDSFIVKFVLLPIIFVISDSQKFLPFYNDTMIPSVDLFRSLFANEELGKAIGVFNMKSIASKDLTSDVFSNTRDMHNMIVSTSTTFEEFPEHIIQIKELDYMIIFVENSLKVTKL